MEAGADYQLEHSTHKGENPMLKIGNKVRYIGSWATMSGRTGTVIQHWPEDRDAGEIIPECASVRPDQLPENWPYEFDTFYPPVHDLEIID
jgi:hypothetical protein